MCPVLIDIYINYYQKLGRSSGSEQKLYLGTLYLRQVYKHLSFLF